MHLKLRQLCSMSRRISHIATPIQFVSNREEALKSKLAPVLQACSNPSPSVLQQGQQVHAQLILNGLSQNPGLLGTRIVGMYILCSSFVNAKNMFDTLDLRYASGWNWLIRGFTNLGRFRFALLFYFKMLGYGTCPDKYTFPYVIKACANLREVGLCKFIHRTIQDMGFEMDVYVCSSLIKLYTENGLIREARCLFDKLPQRDDVLWNVMIKGYVKDGDLDNVIDLFGKMRKSTGIVPNSVTYACVLSVCASDWMIGFGTQLHALVIRCGLEMDSPVANTLVAMYSKCCQFSNACELFDSVPLTELIAWNGMIGGYVQNGFMNEALDLFRKMIATGVKPDSITFASFLPSVLESETLIQGKEIHGYIIRHGVHMDLFLKNALIDMYFKCRAVEMACNVFNDGTAVDIVICTAMVSGYVLNEKNIEALDIFRWLLCQKMQPNALTLASVLPACANLAALKLGKELHSYALKCGFEGNCHVGSAVIDVYAKCGRVDFAHHVFTRMSERDAICWNSIITSHSQNARPQEAIDLFRKMGEEGVKFDCVSISAALSACANLPALHYGKEIHGFMLRGTSSHDIIAESALIDMYAKCGHLDIAHHIFEMMQEKNEVSWNNIIAAYGNHGRLNDCLALFHKMIEEGFQPDHVTFLAIISACGHAGLVDIGCNYFNHMTKEYGIPAQMEHYACMVDLFGRAGRLEEAFQVIKSMPFDPDAGIWGALLGASRVHGHVEFAEVSSRHLFELDPENSGNYVLLANVHADAGKWEVVHKMRSLMKERGVEKVPGYSWIDVNCTTHMFVAADTSHPQSSQIYLLLKNLLLELRKEGYVPQGSQLHQMQAQAIGL